MKAIFIAFLLLASMAFLPSSTLAARELVAVKGVKAATYTVVTAPTKNPNNPAVTCTRNSPYLACKPQPPAPKCSDYTRGCPP